MCLHEACVVTDYWPRRRYDIYSHPFFYPSHTRVETGVKYYVVYLLPLWHMIWLLYDTWGLSLTYCWRVVVLVHWDWIHCNYHRLGMSRQLPIMVVKNTAQEILRFGYPGNSAITATHILWRSNNDWWWERNWPVRTEQSRVYFCWSCVSSSIMW